jgi:hypothetical protein
LREGSFAWKLAPHPGRCHADYGEAVDMLPAFGCHRNRRDFDERLALYERARRNNRWNPVTDINWQRPSMLSEHHRHAAALCAGAGTYTEEVGLLTAARLALEIDDAPVRLCLAKQISDEAKHSEVFARYCHKFGGSGDLLTPPERPSVLLRQLDEIRDPTRLFILHTLIEGMALDQFSVLSEAMTGDVLGEIYRHVMRDEAMHVAMGLDYLKFAFSHGPSGDATEKLTWCRANIPVIAQCTARMYAWLAEISHRTASDVKQMCESRHAKRLNQIQSYISEE